MATEALRRAATSRPLDRTKVTRGRPFLVNLLVLVSGVAVAGLSTLVPRSDNAPALIVTALGVYFAATLAILADGGWDPYSPFSIFVYCHYVLFYVRPLYAGLYQESVNIFMGVPLDEFALQVSLYASVGLVSCALGYSYLASTRPVMRTTYLSGELVVPDETEWRNIKLGLWFVVLIGVSLYSLYVLQVGPGAYFSSLITGRSASTQAALRASSGYISSGLQFGIGALLLLLLRAMIERRTRMVLWLSVLLIALVSPQIATGSRSTFIPIIVVLLVFVSRVFPRSLTSGRLLLILPGVFLVGIIAPRVWRVELAEGGGLGDALARAFSPKEFLGDFAGGLDTAMADAFAVQLRAMNSGLIQLTGGSTYLSTLSAPVPRAIWADKPRSVDTLLNTTLFPSTAAQGTGFSFGIYSEPVLNFGVVGLVLVLFFFGVFLQFVRSGLRSSNFYAFFASAAFTGYVFAIVRGSLSFDLQRYLITVGPALIVVWMLRERSRRFSKGRRYAR